MSPIPFPEVFRPPVPGSTTRTYVALPGLRNARVLIEAGDPAIARRVLAGMGPIRGSRGTGLAVGLLARVHPPHTRLLVAGGAGSVEDHLATRLAGHGPGLAFGWRFGPPRANRKPVGTVVAADGRVVAHVKLGTAPLTRRLVTGEGASLARLGDRVGPLTLPTLIDTRAWGEVAVLVVAPIRHTGGREPSAPSRSTAELAVARVHGIRRDRLATSGFWRALTASVDETVGDPRWAGLRAGVALAHREFGEHPVTLGSWHGDWTRHNLAATPEGIGAWDWERFGEGIPAGFDPLHHRLMRALETGAGTGDLVPGLLARGPEILAHFARAGLVDDPDLTTLLYLLTLADRYRRDRQDATTSVASGFETWLVSRLPGAVEAVAARRIR